MAPMRGKRNLVIAGLIVGLFAIGKHHGIFGDSGSAALPEASQDATELRSSIGMQTLVDTPRTKSNRMLVPQEPLRAEALPTPLVAPLDQFDVVLISARDWINAHQAAHDEASDEVARQMWLEIRERVLDVIRDDPDAACAFLSEIAAWSDVEAGARLATLLPYVAAEGFEDHLIEIALLGDAPRIRGLALTGLRGRGAQGAEAVDQVAARSTDASLQVLATKELGTHLADPAVLRHRRRILQTMAGNLEHPEPQVRIAALEALLVSRDPTSGSIRSRLQALAVGDSHPEVANLARQLSGRLSARD
ncbi:MAG: hypothetical protein GY930_06745 [bacterium]|nr:hypothetical protein [bacterium]